MEDLADEPAFRQRAAAIVDRSHSTIIDAVTELQDLGAVTEAIAEVRDSVAKAGCDSPGMGNVTDRCT